MATTKSFLCAAVFGSCTLSPGSSNIDEGIRGGRSGDAFVTFVSLLRHLSWRDEDGWWPSGGDTSSLKERPKAVCLFVCLFVSLLNV